VAPLFEEGYGNLIAFFRGILDRDFNDRGMCMQHVKNNRITIMLYILGFVMTALGINLLLRSKLGAGPWDAVTFNLSALSNLTLGVSSGLINIALMVFIILSNKNLKYLLLVIPIVSTSIAIDFWDLVVFKDYYPLVFIVRLSYFLGGTYIITLGLAIIFSTGFIAMIFEELTRTLMDVYRIRPFFKARIVIETFAIVSAIILGLIAKIGLGAISYGTIFLALFIGPVITLNLRWIAKMKS
jgi:uncharacterized protein